MIRGQPLQLSELSTESRLLSDQTIGYLQYAHALLLGVEQVGTVSISAQVGSCFAHAGLGNLDTLFRFFDSLGIDPLVELVDQTLTQLKQVFVEGLGLTRIKSINRQNSEAGIVIDYNIHHRVVIIVQILKIIVLKYSWESTQAIRL
ncbi:hypothetical protein M527_01095 [Sphingobium indicum IP26]|nr:hypothetical protein M527_01095 [Sphingobium indicum IP26]